MKKIIAFGVLFLFVFAFSGCELSSTTTTTTTSQTSEDTTTTTTTTATTTTSTSTISSNTAIPLVNQIPEECSSIAVEDGWVPVWCDEFTYTGGIDTTKWSYQTGGGGFGNNEAQYYTSRQDNLYVDGEYLNIIARHESYNGYNYTSSKIWTVNTENWRYGKFEMRAKIPFGRGTWPAFWMMPQVSKYGGWPKSGEIDIMEHVGYDMNEVYGTIHTERFNGSNGRGGNASLLVTQGLIPVIDVANEFHTYGIIWDETSISWYFDGYKFAEEGYDPYLSQSVLYDTTVDWPFDQYFYLILNLAIGGNWGGAQGIDDTIFPATYTIDYVRVYQQDLLSDDSQTPTSPTSPHIAYQNGTTAYLIWTPSEDDNRIARYYVYVNGALSKKTTVPGVQLNGLRADDVNMIVIIAEDYAGNLSNPLETAIVT